MILHSSFDFAMEFLKDRDDAYSVCGFNWTIGSTLIGPCVWNRKWIEEDLKFNVVYHKFVWIYAEENNLCVFLPSNELNALTKDLYDSIIEEFKLQIKKYKEQTKLEKIKNDF